jgi:pimeloyl-ACP methyl ester carboxylesterase
MAIKDLYQLLRHLGVKQAYVGGLSLGGNVALNFGISHPDMVKALIGQRRGQAQRIGKRATRSGTTDREAFEIRIEAIARGFENEGITAMAERYAKEAKRIQLLRKDSRGC